MKTLPRSLSFFFVAILLTPFASAQTRGSGAGHAAASALARSTAAANAQHTAAASSKAASATAAAAGRRASAVHRPAATGATSKAVAATTAAGAQIPTTKGTVNAGIANSTTPPGHQFTPEPGVPTTGIPGGNISASLNSKATAAHIRNATRDNRDQVLADVDSSVKSSSRLLAELRQQAHVLRKDAREDFKSAAEEVRLREKALRESLQVARKAPDQQSAAAQSRLAANYEGYAAAVARTESVVHGSTSTSVGISE